jgi:hypothetical protein
MSLTTVHSKTLGDLTFKVGLLSVANGREMLVRLQRTFGPAIGELAEGRGGVARAFAQVAERLDSKDFTWVCDTLAERSSVVHPDGREQPLKQNIDEIFAGKYGLMLQWIQFSLETNFADFLEPLREAYEAYRASKQKPSASPSQTASTGTSGG